MILARTGLDPGRLVLEITEGMLADVPADEHKASLVQGIINLGESLRLDVITEGIEQPEQAAQLRAMRSPLGQGFLFSRPVEPDALLALLRRSSKPHAVP
jgi:EAL domain-containing protein (putative c-di-GMP-specific phosphodiesterase class I)